MKVLIVGLGSISKKHIEAIKKIDNTAQIFALRSGLSNNHVQGVINLDESDLQNCSVDFAVISNPTHLHEKFIIKLSEKKIPILIEKPPIHSLKNAKKILTQIKKSGVFAYVAFNMRYHPCIIFLKKYLDNNSKKINEVNIYSGSYLPSWRPGTDYKKSYSSNLDMGGGVHLDLIHELDYCLHLFDKPNDYSSIIEKKSNLEIKSPDYAHFVLNYFSFIATITLNYYRPQKKREIEIVFEDKLVSVDLINCKVTLNENELLFSKENFKIEETYLEQMKYFISQVHKNNNSYKSFEDSLDVLKIALGES